MTAEHTTENRGVAGSNPALATPGMHRDQRHDLTVYRFESLPDGVEALVSTRRGGVSSPPYESLNLGLRVGDDPEKVVENRRLLFRQFGISLERSVWCKQIHADGVVVVGAEDAGRGSTEEESIVEDADALVTDTPGLSLCVTVADCVPVVVSDPERGVVGLAHAGWGGTVSRIASRTVEVMGERFGCDPAAVLAAIGPSIGPAGYEVGEDVIERARAGYGERASEILEPAPDGKAFFDLWTANRIDLEDAGVSGERIEVSAIAVDEHLDEFYSHRHEGGQTGRFVTAVTLRP
jgi:polyphenol oxidase